ncbi:MAG: ATP-grasp domain-containing protein [Bacteroidaceae bacterium]|nr:ATP-grasp domain-containing protein [Bacteroidaceae bacterium]
MSKNVLVLPGTQWQVTLIEKIQEMGHKALVVNPDPEAPGMKKADLCLVSNIFDKKRVIGFGRDQKISAVMSDECDIAMNLVAELGTAFHVPTLDEETAALYTDKFLMREFSKKHGLKYPEYRFCKTVEDAVSLLKEINKPIIIKPLDSNASHGVFRCDTVEDIRKHFDESMSFSRVEKSVLAERFIVGTEFTIDGVKTPNGHFTMAISEKKHFAHNESIANELLFSHYNPNFDYDKLRATNDAFVMKSNLQFGFTHAEYKFEDGDFYLIEIAARGGGNMISSCITQFMTGYDTYRYLVECATGNVHYADFSLRPEYKERAAVLKFFETPNGGGKVREIKGLDYLDNEPDIKHYRLNFKIGDTIEDALNDSVRIGFYIVCSENMQKLREVISNVQKNFQIIY